MSRLSGVLIAVVVTAAMGFAGSAAAEQPPATAAASTNATHSQSATKRAAKHSKAKKKHVARHKKATKQKKAKHRTKKAKKRRAAKHKKAKKRRAAKHKKVKKKARRTVSLPTGGAGVPIAPPATAPAPVAQPPAPRGPGLSLGPVPEITVLSNRGDLISGGDALVRIAMPARAASVRPKVLLQPPGSVPARDVGAAFERTGERTFEGLVEGLATGVNRLDAVLPDGSGASIEITDHPTGGPVFAGPQIQPWVCQEGALDPQCNQPPYYQYRYKPTNPFKVGLKSYDPENPPAARDIATTVTENGTRVPFVVRIETGYVGRDQYKISTLFDPAKGWASLAPQPQFNHKLLVTHGASCDITYGVGEAPSVTKYNPAAVPIITQDVAELALGRGFVVMSTAADNSGHNCNIATQAESLIMAKERVIERYGQVRYTVGAGCSGGSLALHWLANAYPGIYDGILPTCSFPDTWSSAIQVMDYHLIQNFMLGDWRRWFGENFWTLDQWAAVAGSPSPLNTIISNAGFYNAIVPDRECKPLEQEDVYSADKNPAGVRCSVADFNINIFGPRPADVWSDVEKKLGHGFADVPVDNVGVQYGLAALNGRQISREQFVQLNEQIGGVDVDGNPVPTRIRGNETALARAYRSGSINETNNMGGTAIIDCRGPDPGLAHDSYRAWALRARLDRANGNHANQVIWEGGTLIIGDTRCAPESLTAMERWLDAVEADTSAGDLAVKVARNRPADVEDTCWDGLGSRWLRGRTCPREMVPVYGTPRTVAGDAITTDTNKCRLKPLDPGDYGSAFSGSQWARLKKVFPDGVCDYSKPGVGFQRTVGWLRYDDGKGGVAYGGTPMGQAPESAPIG